MTGATFDAERDAHIRGQGADPDLHARSLDWICRAAPHRYVYNFSWLGRPVIQFPQDLLAGQEIAWRTRPDLVIETGIAHGGSLVFWASMLELLGGRGRVVGIDVEIRPHNRDAIESHPLAHRITMIEGSSVDPTVAGRVAAIASEHERVMVALDAHHAHDHVLAELRAYGPLVSPGCYLVVYDTIIEDLPPGFLGDDRFDVGDNPKTAVHAYLAETNRFEIDRAIPDQLLITSNPDGYLRCTGA